MRHAIIAFLTGRTSQIYDYVFFKLAFDWRGKRDQTSP